VGKSPKIESPKKKNFSVFESYGVASPRKTKNFDASSLLYKFETAKLNIGSFSLSPGKSNMVYGLSPTNSSNRLVDMSGLNVSSFDHLPNHQAGEQLLAMTGSKLKSNEINLSG
jgi:hypothetical protein